MTEVYNTQDTNLLKTGLSEAKLRGLTSQDVFALRGIVRLRVLTDLNERFIPIRVRANPEVLKDFNRDRKRKPDQPLSFDFEETRHEIGTEWVPMRASLASVIHLRSFEDATLGAATMKMASQDDGYGGKHFVPTPVPAFEGLLEFAMPTEYPQILVATS